MKDKREIHGSENGGKRYTPEIAFKIDSERNN